MIKTLRLTTEGRAIVPIEMKPFTELALARVNFKLDTGADITTVSKKELNILGYDNAWIKNNITKHPTRTITRAGGEEESAHYVQISKCNVLGRDLTAWPFYIRPESDKDFPNLLGIDIISHFDFSFKYSQGDLIIQPIKVSAIQLDKVKNQDIFELSV